MTKEKILSLFHDWAKFKPLIHFAEREIYFRERQIWWVSIGQNIGSEQNGKHGNFERPVIILKKFNAQTFLGIPISTKIKEGAHRHIFINNGARFSANLSQMRVMSSKRLLRSVANMPIADYEHIKQMYRKMI